MGQRILTVRLLVMLDVVIMMMVDAVVVVVVVVLVVLVAIVEGVVVVGSLDHGWWDVYEDVCLVGHPDLHSHSMTDPGE